MGAGVGKIDLQIYMYSQSCREELVQFSTNFSQVLWNVFQLLQMEPQSARVWHPAFYPLCCRFRHWGGGGGAILQKTGMSFCVEETVGFFFFFVGGGLGAESKRVHSTWPELLVLCGVDGTRPTGGDDVMRRPCALWRLSCRRGGGRGEKSVWFAFRAGQTRSSQFAVFLLLSFESTLDHSRGPLQKKPSMCCGSRFSCKSLEKQTGLKREVVSGNSVGFLVLRLAVKQQYFNLTVPYDHQHHYYYYYYYYLPWTLVINIPTEISPWKLLSPRQFYNQCLSFPSSGHRHRWSDRKHELRHFQEYGTFKFCAFPIQSEKSLCMQTLGCSLNTWTAEVLLS